MGFSVYMVYLLPHYVSLDYESIKLVTANIPMQNGRMHAVLWRRHIGQSSGVSGGNVHSQIWVFRAQRIPVPYNITATHKPIFMVMGAQPYWLYTHICKYYKLATMCVQQGAHW